MRVWNSRSAPIAFLVLLSIASSLDASDLGEVKRRGKLVMLCFPHEANQFITTSDGAPVSVVS
jgi:hypothetical protein